MFDYSPNIFPEYSEIIGPSVSEKEQQSYVPQLTIQQVNRSSTGSLGNKKHCCVYCEKLLPNIARHMTRKHKNEIDVGRIFAYPKSSKQRRQLWGELVNKGNFSHNFNVLQSGKGTIIPKYRSGKTETKINNLLPCQYCRGMYRRKELWRHQKSCKKTKPTFVTALGPVASGKRLLPPSCGSQEFHDNIISNMKNDDITVAVLSDDCIKEFGISLYNKQGHQKYRHVYISQKMRELGRLLLEARKQGLQSIQDCMKKISWGSLIISVKNLGQFGSQSNLFGIPSLALKVGHSMKICAKQLLSKALKEGDKSGQDVATIFLDLYKLGWRKEISGRALNTLATNKYNCPKVLPIVEDVMKLNKYLEVKGKGLEGSETAYHEFSQLCLAQIILFNHKRGGETKRMTIKQFQDAQVGGNVDSVIMSMLTEFEKTLCKSLLCVEIVGKEGRKVPVLLTKSMERAIDMLLKMRANEKIEGELLFARPGSVKTPFRGVDCLRNHVKEAGLSNPESITSTSLRKQLATLAQVLNLTDASQDLLATFQGHDIKIHREFHCLPDEILQVAKVSRLLHWVNNGTIGKYKGFDFDDIQFDLNGKSKLCF